MRNDEEINYCNHCLSTAEKQYKDLKKQIIRITLQKELQMKVKIKLIKNGKLPVFKHEDDACADCYTRLDGVIPICIEPSKRTLIPLGFALALPIDYEAVIRGRSGLSSKGIDVCIGTIDSGYRGEVMACVINNSDSDYYVCNGERICQIAIRKLPSIEFDVCEELNETERGQNGFGSTGVLC